MHRWAHTLEPKPHASTPRPTQTNAPHEPPIPPLQYEALHACMDKNKEVFDALLAEMKSEEEAKGGGSGESAAGEGGREAAAPEAAAAETATAAAPEAAALATAAVEQSKSG